VAATPSWHTVKAAAGLIITTEAAIAEFPSDGSVSEATAAGMVGMGGISSRRGTDAVGVETKIYGSIQDNLMAAVRSARRLHNHPVHADTLKHWNDLLHYARQELASGAGDQQLIEALIADLGAAVADRGRSTNTRPRGNRPQHKTGRPLT
jgi:hypothetical protein